MRQIVPYQVLQNIEPTNPILTPLQIQNDLPDQSTSFQKFQGGMPQHSGALRTPPYSPLLQNPVKHPGDCYVQPPHTYALMKMEDGGARRN